MQQTPEEISQEKLRYEKIAQNHKRHHWVPQFYLRFFATSPGGKRIYLYQSSSKPLHVGIADVAASKELYTFEENENGGKTRMMEGVFSEHENIAAGVLSEVIRKECLPERVEDRSHIAVFVSLLKVRGPSFAEWLRNMEIEHIKLFQQSIAENADLLRKEFEDAGIAFSSDEEFEETRKFMLNPEGYTVKMKGGEGYYFKQAMDLSKEFYNILMSKKSWHLLVAPDKRHFITSDNPVVIQEPEDCPPHLSGGILNGTVLLTISPRLCLAFRRIPLINQKIFLSREDVNNINKSVARAARRHLYSHIDSKDLMALCNELLVGNDSKVTIKRLVRYAPYYISTGIPQYGETDGLRLNSASMPLKKE